MTNSNDPFDFDAQAPDWFDCLNDPNNDALPDFEPGSPVTDDIIEAIAAFSPDYHNNIRVKAEASLNPFGLIASAVRGLATWLGF